MPTEISKIISRLHINNPKLTYLSLCWSECSSTKDVVNIADALRRNKTLLSLRIDGHGLISEDGAKAIANALKENTALRSVVLIGSKISKEAIIAMVDVVKQKAMPFSLEIDGETFQNEQNLHPPTVLVTEKSEESEEDFYHRVLSMIKSSDDKISVITTENLFQRLKRFKELTDKSIKLIDIFSEAAIDGKLQLDDIDFYRLGLDFESIDFEGCIFSRCDFSYLYINNCDFSKAIIKNNCNFEGAYVSAATIDLSSKRQAEDQLSQIQIEYESEDDSYEREKYLALNIYRNYPRDIFIYDQIIAHDRNEFVECRMPGDDKYRSTELGWKLHLSVHPDDLPQAFNIAAPIISYYCRVFKVINRKVLAEQNEDPTKSNFYFSKQITIYLERNYRPVISEKQAKEMVDRVTAAFRHEKIRAGQAPKSDAQTISEYFSLRNDKFDACGLLEKNDESVEKSEYMPAQLVGTNYNPCNYHNPFAILLTQQNKFDLVKHFDGFNSFDEETSRSAFYISICAWLNECTHISALTPQEKVLLRKQAFSYSEEIDEQFIKPEYQSIEGMRSAVRIAVCLIYWVTNNHLLNNYFFSMLAFYPYRDAFANALAYMEDKFAQYQSATKSCVIKEWDDDQSYFWTRQYQSLIEFLLMQWQLNAKSSFQAKCPAELINQIRNLIYISPCQQVHEQLFHVLSPSIFSNDPFERMHVLELMRGILVDYPFLIPDNQNILSLVRFLQNHIEFLETKILLAELYVTFYKCTEAEINNLIKDILNEFTKNVLPKELIYSYFGKVLNILCRTPDKLVGRLIDLALHDVAPAQLSLALILSRDINHCSDKFYACFNLHLNDLSLKGLTIHHRFAVRYFQDYLANRNNVYSPYTYQAYTCLAEVKKQLAKDVTKGNVDLMLDIATTLNQHPYIAKEKSDSKEKVMEIVTDTKRLNPS